MTVAAIISEYNPFHNGHKFHIEETRTKTNADAIVVIMSGGFVQRGDVAIYSKEARAKAAMRCGADLVLELPTPYACASAEFFAKGAVKTLDALGLVNHLSFGAECDDIEEITSIAQLLSDEPAKLSEKIQEFTSKGLSFPSARANAIEKIFGKAVGTLISTPNNILGIEYCKALNEIKSNILPCPVLRKGAVHDSVEVSRDIASASHIRNLILDDGLSSARQYLPGFICEIFEAEKLHSITELEKAIICHLVKMNKAELCKIADVAEGLENRIKAAALISNTLDELIENIKTKRYTHSRLRRIILNAFLGLDASQRNAEPKYIKILDHNEVGRKIISAAKKTSTLPLVRNTSQVIKLQNPEIKRLWEQERILDKIFKMAEL